MSQKIKNPNNQYDIDLSDDQHEESEFTPNYNQRKGSLQLNRILIGVGGGSAAGKTTLCNLIRHQIQYDGLFKVLIISLDCFYRPVDKTKVKIEEYDFDHPSALDFDMAYDLLKGLLEGRSVKIPRYNFKTHSREQESDNAEPCDVILFEGILALYSEKINNLMQMKIFMHCDDDIRLCRRLVRDNAERGRSVESILMQYNKFVKPSYDQFIKPTLNFADMIVNGSINNQVTVKFIVSQLKNKAKELDWYSLQIVQEMVLFGDQLEYIEDSILQDQNELIQNSKDYSIKENLDVFEKFLIFPILQEMKEKIKSKFKRLLKFQFDKEKLSKNKNFLKYIIELLDKLACTKKIDYKNLSVLNVSNYQDYKPNPLIPNQILLFPIFCLMTNEQKELIKYLSFFEKNFPKVQIILMPIISSMRSLQIAKQQCKNVIHVINCLIIGNKEKFSFNFKLNYKPTGNDSKEEPFKIKFLSDAYCQFLQEHINKKVRILDNQEDQLINSQKK